MKETENRRFLFPSLKMPWRVFLEVLNSDNKCNATRDYLDFVALAGHLGEMGVAQALESVDRLYWQENDESPLLQLQVQLANALPYDPEGMDLSEYNHLAPRWRDWNTVSTACARISTMIFERICQLEDEKSDRDDNTERTHKV